VGFELTSDNKCNCLLSYQTVLELDDDGEPVWGNLTRDDLNFLQNECSLSDGVIPAIGDLYLGEGAAIGSVGFGDTFQCYSVSDRNDMEGGQANLTFVYILHHLIDI
jgi:hypothetical protein